MTDSYTNLTIVCRHRWSRKMTRKVDKYLKLSARTVVFISRRLTPVLSGAARGETGSRGGGGLVKLLDVYTWEYQLVLKSRHFPGTNI